MADAWLVQGQHQQPAGRAFVHPQAQVDTDLRSLDQEQAIAFKEAGGCVAPDFEQFKAQHLLHPGLIERCLVGQAGDGCP
ncbi:hypothetical protein D9M73_262960 [compost metagenome]